jgi:hypothetical protein
MADRRPRPILMLAMAFALVPIACQGADRVPETVSIAEATRFLGTPLPAAAKDVRVAGEQGMDRLVLLRFDIDAAGADAFARSVAGGPLIAGRDPNLGYLGATTAWWVRDVPAGSAGAQATTGNQTVKLLSTPAEGGLRHIYVAAFSQ